ncbi:MAG: sulfate adenylyltransferase subunit CysN [Robiginitomaculum sp.]|nr:sulfate adenylyltransferase subunit CysN [Robiginitomaculum sp.]
MASQLDSKDLLRFITCGSVDDGKSTLIGRLLYDSKQVFDDQLMHADKDGAPDLASLVDGLAAEREQGITIDVAYRYFSTAKRKFIVADTPGHEQYTRNMATGASTADLAVLLIDARYGVQVQTRRHAFITSLLGIKHVVVAINKMDLVEFSQKEFNQIEEDFREFADGLNFTDIRCIPICATDGDNVIKSSERMSWYRGQDILSTLESVEINRDETSLGFRFPVQWVNRANADFRGYAGTIYAGEISKGDEIIAVPSGKTARVERIVTMDGDLNRAVTHQAVTLTLDEKLDISRGDFICTKVNAPQHSDQFQASILWMGEDKLFPGRGYLLKTCNRTVPASVTDLKYKVDVNDFTHISAKTLALNEIGICNLSLGKSIVFDAYKGNRTTGSFILIDRHTNETVAAGMLNFSLRRASNLTWQKLEVGKAERAEQKHQKPAVLWFTGLSGSGKSTIANLVEKRLFDMGKHTYTLDGDNVRHGLNKDLGFTDADRIENIRRIGETAKLMADAGLVVLVSFISPFTAERNMARRLMEDGEFIEIHVNTPLAVAEQRDVKGLYAKARAGKIKNFTGIDSEYQEPKNPEIVVDTVSLTPEQSAEKIVTYLEENRYIEIGE